MTDKEQIKAAKKFAAKWNGRGKRETSNTQHFWTKLLENIFEVEDGFELIDFNETVNVEDSEKEYDAIIKSTKVLIEQKKRGKNLDKKYLQSDGAMLTPFEQAKRYVEGYNDEKEHSEDCIHWVVTCNFQTFRIYDVRSKDSLSPDFENNNPVVTFRLRELHENIKYLKFLVDPNDDTLKAEVQISKTAAVIIREIRKILRGYYNKNDIENLNKLCMRLVFLYYADDSKLIGGNILEKYFENHKYTGETLKELFNVLNQAENLRDDSISDELKNFPYVNGGLFEENITIPDFQDSTDFEIRRAIIEGLFEDFPKFPWQKIDPPTFGAMFEGILNDDARRAEGMHYTSVENIHKIIDPLFFNGLKKRFNRARRDTPDKIDNLLNLQTELSNMIFLDPACGSGNFLTETYLSLRRLENDIISELKISGCTFSGNIKDSIKVSIRQFYGIEINNYAAAVAQVALWISENKAFQRTEAILGTDKNSGLPLSSYRQIVNANALQIDWNDILPKDTLTGKQIFIIGNPPYVGYTYQTPQQKQDLLDATHLKTKKLDYVVSWYFKAAEFIQDTDIRCAFVSTNSITQGEQVAVVWKPLFEKIHFDFVYRTFKWTSDSDKMAAVHCVIIGFSAGKSRKNKTIHDGEKIITAKNINAYLVDGENVFVESRTKAVCPVPEMNKGSIIIDDGNLIITAENYEDFIKREPAAKKYIRRYMGADDFINGKRRYCLWLVGVSLEEILSMPLVAERVEKLKKFRLKSSRSGTIRAAQNPMLFAEIRQPNSDYIAIPVTSSENRRYIPIGFIDKNIIANGDILTIPDATIYHFGILISSVHMAWTRAVCGRLESRYRYSKDIVYNNFVWCTPTAEQRAEIERTAQNILDVLSNFKDWTLAKLYDEKTMPAELRAAHLANDKAVLAAYGFDENFSEAQITAALFEKYRALTSTTPPVQEKFR